MEKNYFKVLKDVEMQNLFRFASYMIDFFKIGKLDYDLINIVFQLLKI